MTKEIKYTAEQTAELEKLVKAGASLEVMAEAMGKSVRSVIAKLSQMQLYAAKAKTRAEARQTKAQLVLAVAAKLDLDAEVLASLEKADKAALEALATAVVA